MHVPINQSIVFSSHMQLKHVDRSHSSLATAHTEKAYITGFFINIFINLKMDSLETMLTYALPKQKTFD